MSSGLDWERFGVITGGDEVCILPPPILSEKGVGIPTLSISLLFLFFMFLVRKIPFAGIELTSQRVRRLLHGLKKNQNAPRPSEHPPVMGEKMSKRGTNPIHRDSFVRTDQSQTSLAGKYCEI